MNPQLTAREATCRLLSAAWDPQNLPAPDAVPWADVLPLVERAGLGGLLHTLIGNIRPGIPSDVRHALEQAFYRTAAANARALHQLAGLAPALKIAGVPVLLLKGAALANALYPDPALRPVGDIDLLVRRSDVPACRQALLERGYCPQRPPERPGSVLAHHNEELFQPPHPYEVPVEVHWHLLDVPYYMSKVDVEWFWDHSEALSLAGQRLQSLTPEANLLYLSAHLGLHHQFRGLLWLLDLALLVVRERERLDWARIADLAQSSELLTVLRATLDRLADCWPSLPLDEPRRALRAVVPTRMDARLFRLLTAESRSNPLDWYTTLVSLPGFAARARFVWVNAFPDAAYMKDRYGFEAGWQLPYWYLRRLVGGLGRLARILPKARRVERE